MTEKPTNQNDQDGTPTPQRRPAGHRVGPAFAEPETTVADLSREIVQALPRAAGERITCRRISGNHYRCNWWAAQNSKTHDNPTITGLDVTTHRVSKSSMFLVTKSANGLSIKPISRG
jgi:hypothetical protein